MALFSRKLKILCLLRAMSGLFQGANCMLTEYATLTQCAEDASFMGYLDGLTDNIFNPSFSVTPKNMARTATTCNGAWINIELQYEMAINTVLLINRDGDTVTDQ